MVNDLSAALNFDVDSFVSLYKLFVFVSFVYQCFFILSCKAASIDSRRRSVSCSIVDKIGLYRYNSVYIVDTITIIIYFVSRNPVWERRTRPTWHVTSMNKTEFVIKKKKKKEETHIPLKNSILNNDCWNERYLILQCALHICIFCFGRKEKSLQQNPS